jgi:hypothetical protein
MLKMTLLAAAAFTTLSLQTTVAAAQATPVSVSPANARTSNAAMSAPRLNRMIREARGFDGFAAQQPAHVWDKHTANISSY